MHLGEKAPRQPVQLGLPHLIGTDFDQGVVPALRPRAHHHPTQRTTVGAPPRRFLGGRQTSSEKPTRRVEHLRRRQTGAMKVFHARRRVSELSTTLSDDHAMAALATTGDNNRPVKGYSAPAA